MGKVLERLAWNKCVERNEDTKDLKQRNQLGAYFNHLRKYTENLNWDNDNGKERKIYSTSQMEQCYRYKINRTWRLSTYDEGEWGINSDCRFGSWMPGNMMPLICGSHLDFVLGLTAFLFIYFLRKLIELLWILPVNIFL